MHSYYYTFSLFAPAPSELCTLSLHDALPIFAADATADPSIHLTPGAGAAATFRRRSRCSPTAGRFDRRIVAAKTAAAPARSEEHTSELQSQSNLVCRPLLEKKNVSPTHS